MYASFTLFPSGVKAFGKSTLKSGLIFMAFAMVSVQSKWDAMANSISNTLFGIPRKANSGFGKKLVPSVLRS